MRRITISGTLSLLFTFLLPPCAAQNVITTVAGSTWIFRGDGGPALNAPLGRLQGVAVDTAGNVYLGDRENHIVAKISPTGTLTVVAGNGINGFSGDGGPAASASLRGPEEVTLDSAGNLYIADRGNNRIRKVSPAGIITTVFGNGSSSFSGDGGPAISASGGALGVAVDSAGNLYIADDFNNRVRKVSASGIITTLAGNGSAAYSGDGGPATSAALNRPAGVAVDQQGNVYIADRSNHRIRKVSPSGTITTVAGTGANSFSGDGGPATSAALNSPEGLFVDTAGNLYIADLNNNRVRRVSPSGTISTVAGQFQGYAGDGGPATAARLFWPSAVVLDAAGNLYIADGGNNRIRSVNALGNINTIAGNGLFQFAGDGGTATSASLRTPYSVALDGTGGFYIADQDSHRVRKVAASGTISTYAGNGGLGSSGDGGPATSAQLGFPYGLVVDGSQNLFIAHDGAVRKVSAAGIMTTVGGGGGPGTIPDGSSATSGFLDNPRDVALDAAGNLYVAETLNYRIRKITPSGIISTVAGNGTAGFSGDGGSATAASLNRPQGVAVDTAGNVFISDQFNHRIRKVTPAGTISTIAGTGTSGFSGDNGPATSARLYYPLGLALDAAGNLYVADTFNQRVRRIAPNGIISTVAGTGSSGFSGDGGPATTASLNFPADVALDAAGNLYIADGGNDRIRKVLSFAPSFTVSPTSLSFSAQAGFAPAPNQFALTGNVPNLTWQASVRTQSGGNWLSISPSSGQMPATVTVSVDATTLAAGAYKGSIDVFVPAATPSLLTVTVTLTVASAQPANLSVQPAAISFQVVAGTGAPPAQALRIENTGAGTLAWTARATTVGGNWLSISPSSGTAPARVQVSASPAGLAAGSYAGSITVTSATTGQSVTVPANLLVSSPTAALLLSQNHLLFRAVEAGGSEPPQTLGVLNVGAGSVDWTAEATVPWLRVSPSSGRSDAGSSRIPQVTVSVDPAGLAAGFYVGQVRVTAAAANNSPQVVRVDTHVLAAGGRLGNVVRPTGLTFVAAAGGSSPGSQEVRVSTPESAPVEFLSQPIGGDWVTRVPDTGSATRDAPGRIVVQPDLGSLSAGIYRAALTVFTTNDGDVHPVKLLFVVLAPGTATPSVLRSDGQEAPRAAQACNPSQLLLQFASLFSSFNATVGWPTTVLVNARDDCGNPAVGGTVTLSFSSGEPTLVLTDLKNGQYQGSWRPSSPNAQAVVTARGSLGALQGEATATAAVGANPNPQGNILAQGGVLLGAGFERGPVAPGSIVSLFGQKLAPSELLASSLPLPTTLNGVRVLVGGVAAPLFYVGPGQVNAQVPVELSGERQLQVVVETNGIPSAPEPIQTSGNRPGIFTLGGTFGNQGAILIANTNRLAMPVTANVPSEPVPVGGFISIYCTGLGPTDPPVKSGEPGPATSTVKTPVTVTIGGQTATVTFAGLAPGFAGVYQVNAQVPAGLTPGNAVPVVLTQASFQSNTATIAVR